MGEFTVRVPSGECYGPAGEEVLLRWAAEGRIPPTATLIDEHGVESPALAHERLRPILQAPPTRPGPIAPRGAVPSGDGGITTLIPYHNPPALIGYYVSVGSLIPILALLLGPTAIVLGCVGLNKRKADPRVKGMAHAIVAIVLGGLTTLANLALLTLAFGLNP